MTPELLTAAAILYAANYRESTYSHEDAVKDARTLAALLLKPEKEPVALPLCRRAVREET